MRAITYCERCVNLTKDAGFWSLERVWIESGKSLVVRKGYRALTIFGESVEGSRGRP
jgi:hypothetical protein